MTARLSNFFNLTAGKTNESSFDIFLLFTSLDYCRPVFCFVELESTSGRHCCILVSSHEMQMPISSQRQHQRPPNWQQDFFDSSPLAGDKEFSTIIFFHLIEIFFFRFWLSDGVCCVDVPTWQPNLLTARQSTPLVNWKIKNEIETGLCVYIFLFLDILCFCIYFPLSHLKKGR